MQEEAGNIMVSIHQDALVRGQYIHSCGGRISASFYDGDKLASIKCATCGARIMLDKDSHVIELVGDPLDFDIGGLQLFN